jgi:PAS domain S-box-containing protein
LWRELPPRGQLLEGGAVVCLLILASIYVLSHPTSSWVSFSPGALVLPMLLWLAARCHPSLTIAGAFVVASAAICATIFGLGRFGDAAIPILERVKGAQVAVTMVTAYTLVLAALFSERRQSERALKQALDGAKLGAFSADLATGHLECDLRAAGMHGQNVPPTTIKEARRFVHRDDLIHIDTALAKARDTGGVWNAEYRVMHPPNHPHAGETRWVAVEGSIVCDSKGLPKSLLGVTRDITYGRQAEQTLAERNAQLALAGKFALVASFAFDVGAGTMQVSPGYAAVHELPEGTEEISRDDWRAGVHPDDLPRVEADFKQAMAERRREHYCEYRIVRSSGEIRWIDSRSLISYDRDGAARLVGANIDVTQRKQTEAELEEHKASLVDALAAGQVMAFNWDAVTGQSRRSDNTALILGIEQDRGDRSTRDEFLRRVHPDDRHSVKTQVRQLCPSNPSYALIFRFCCPNGEPVWLEESAKGEFDPAGRLLRIKGLTRNITQRKKAELVLEERNVQLSLAAKIGLVGSFAYDTHTEMMQISEGYAAIHGFPERTTEIARSECLAGVHPNEIARVNLRRSEAFRERRREYNVEYRIVRPSGEIRCVETRCFIAYEAAGDPKRVVGVSIDITERKRAEGHQRALVAELDHRVKNVLATVSAVAGQTLETSSSMSHFVAALDGRIRSMATAHELLSTRQWKGVPMAELIRREFAAYASDSNTKIDGPEVMLNAEAGQAMATVIHELVTNAAKYGALSTPSGHVSVQWYRKLNGSAQFVVIWQEAGGPRVEAPRKSGYGTGVVRDLIPYEFGGTVDLSFASEGVRCRLEMPFDRISSDSPDMSGSERLHRAGRSSSALPT